MSDSGGIALEIEVAELARQLAGAASPLLVDVREPDEHAAGVIPGALLVPLGTLESRIGELAADVAAGRVTDRSGELAGHDGRDIVAYCATGRRSAEAVARLRALGYATARSLRGGIAAWERGGLALADAFAADASAAQAGGGLERAQLERYSRQLRLPEVGLAGQRRLLAARVLCIGAGGLGSPASLYLAAAGVGCLGLVDADEVALSNLHRQVLHTTARVGMAKTASAAHALAALNPDVRLQLHPVRLDAANALDLLAGYDVVVDGSDNFATRYLVNDAAMRLHKPFVSGAVLGFEGQVSVFTGAPCYRCVFPVPPPAGSAPSCQEAGVLGVLPGVIGLLQATEALKLVLGIGTSLRGRLLTFDALAMRFTELAVRADPGCPVCSSTVRSSTG